MEIARTIQLQTRASLIVQLRDSASGGSPIGPSPTVCLSGVPQKPYSKSDGSFIFNDLCPGDYRLEIESLYYFRIEKSVSVANRPNNVVFVQIPLVHRPSFPFRVGDTLIRLSVQGRDGRQAERAAVSAAVLSEEAAPYRLAQDEAKAGDTKLTISPGSIRIGPGDKFILKGRGASVEEAIEVTDSDTYMCVTLAAPIRYTYPRGSVLLPVFETITNDDGEAVIVCNGCRSRHFQVELAIISENGRLSASRVVHVQDGQTIVLGTIPLK